MSIRNYDEQMVAKFGVVTQTGADMVTRNVATVIDLRAPVPVLFGLPEDWFETFALPAISVRRVAMMPDMSRRLPGFRGQELSTNPATPNTWNIQAYSSEPFLLLYDIELAANRQADLNALLQHVLLKFPPNGYGSFLTVFGTVIPFRQTAFMDRTDTTKNADGRVLRYSLTYTVEAWLTPLDCTKVKQILAASADAILLTVEATMPPVAE